MMDALLPFLAIAGGLGVGYLLYLRFTRHVTILGASFRALIAFVWVLAALATVIQGFVYAGFALTVIFFSIFLSNADRAHRAASKQDGTRKRIADILKPDG
ncbi:hypothetical protein [Halorubellus sp. PRR65]|uniref:hypothetical protein n=1 Tax=Halorubellus sp. PRR65 TaxID=3098148 RepID=UPI002B2567D5|nr:hypothetical protein [Halorubellus sp. PRR65]